VSYSAVSIRIRQLPQQLTAHCNRKYPQFQQGEIFGLQDAFRKLDLDDKGYLDEGTVIKAAQQSEHQPYDVVRQALKEVELDSSRRVELDDYVDVCGTPLIRHKVQELTPAAHL
jgi:Ca2+-binding EF-hand superfamily protein